MLLPALLLSLWLRSTDGGAAAPPPPPAAVESRARTLMSTEVTVTLVRGRARRASDADWAAAFAPFEQAERDLNEWREGSPLGRLNASAGSGAWVALPAALCEVLRASLAGAERTGGLFDPTWAGMRGLWRFGTGMTGEVPSEAAVKEHCARVGYRRVEVRPAEGSACEARLPAAGMAVGLGGVAKGWAVDRAAAALRARGRRDFLVQAGGDLYAAGRRGGRPWRVGIRDPRGEAGTFFASLEVEDAAFSTSGDYERFFVAGGVRYHHLIDPRTCQPGTASRSATVLAPTALEAEFLTKAAFLLGGEEALALARRHGAEAVLVTRDNAVLVSEGLRGRLRWRAPSP